MVATEKLDLKDGHALVLPINARSILLEVDIGSGSNLQLQTSHDNNVWHNVGAAVNADSLTSFDDSSENFLQYVRVINYSGTTKVNLFFGRSK